MMRILLVLGIRPKLIKMVQLDQNLYDITSKDFPGILNVFERVQT